MHSITIISATNRADSNTEKISKYYLSVLKNKGIDSEIFSLKDLPESILHSDLYGKRSEDFQKIIDFFITSQNKFIFISVNI
jgi:multimeric flavodoxin WrbA